MTFKLISHACVFVMCVTAASAAPAMTEYYVSTTGSDADPGTLAQPFATIQHAVSVMNPGDACYIRGGVYRETVDLSGVGGVSGAPITLTCYQDEEVILEGTVPITSNWTQHSGNIYKTTLPERVGVDLFYPTDDTYATMSEAKTNYGSELDLRVRGSSGTEQIAFLKFDVSGTSGPIQSAALKLRTTSESINDATIYSVADTSWDEMTLTWNNKPVIGSSLAGKSNLVCETWHSFDITSAISGDGTYSFAVQTTLDDAKLGFVSKERGDPAVLEISYDGRSGDIDTGDIWQLFVDGKMMTLARFPNALTFSEQMWDKYGSRRIRDVVKSTNGHVVDHPNSGATDTLAGAGVSFNGCVALLNFSPFATSAREVLNHTAGSDNFDYSPALSKCKDSGMAYLFEGGVNGAELVMLDMAEEWAYDESTNTLYLWADDGLDPTGRTIVGKNQSYFFEGDSTTRYITINRLDFFATAFKFQCSDYITIQNCDLNYFSYSKRALGSLAWSEPAFFVGAPLDFCVGCIVHNCEFNYSSGAALACFYVDSLDITNNLFYQTSYACATRSNEMTVKTINTLDIRGLVVRRNTIEKSGCGQTINLDITSSEIKPWVAEYNYLTAGSLQQGDGAAIHSAYGNVVESVARYNWMCGNTQRDFRWDGRGKPLSNTNANVYRNVALATDAKDGEVGSGDGYRLKGGYHEIYNNIGIGAKSELNVALDKGGNPGTVTRNNAADLFTNDPIPGTASNNFIGQNETKTMKDLLRDPDNFDFRPRADATELIDAGVAVTCSVNGQNIDVTAGYNGAAPDIGAYEYGDTEYWIPGRIVPQASMPVPPSGNRNVQLDADLMWLGGMDATSYDVYFDTDPRGLTFQGSQTNNIFSPGPLAPDTVYYWRIDSVGPGGIVTGEVWTADTTPAMVSAEDAVAPAAFGERMGAAPVGGGFAMDDYWVWCGSVIRGGDGKYHMFASRWPKAVRFTPNWMTNSEVVRAVADEPEGPYAFAEVVLPPRGKEYWDGMMTHNPTIHKSGDTYLLFYTGTTYDFPRPTADTPVTKDQRYESNGNQRIGLATAPSVLGPWTRRDEPILDTRPGKWDHFITTNPAPCVRDNGGVLLIYKSKENYGTTLKLGAAFADHYAGPYRRLSGEPIFDFGKEKDKGVEDAYVWWVDDHYEAIMKDMTGAICGERHGGIHGWSRDGVAWHVSEPAKAYSKTVRWSDGTVTTQGQFERPQLLVENGRPTHLFVATGDGPGGFSRMTRSWNMVVPLDK